MMGRGLLILLKAGRGRRESAKQVEIRLAILLNILGILRSEARMPRKGRVTVVSGLLSDGYG